MAKEEKIYSRVEEAEEMIQKICEKYPDVLWCVRPKMVTVYGIENKEKPKKSNVLAKIKPVKGVEKAIMLDNNISVQYIIEIYWSEFNKWSVPQKQWIMFHELLHIHRDIGKLIKHDCEDFRVILESVGVDYLGKENLPNLLISDVKFNLELRPSLDEDDKEDKDGEPDDNAIDLKEDKEI